MLFTTNSHLISSRTSVRFDIQDKTGLQPSRASASTTAMSSSSSTSLSATVRAGVGSHQQGLSLGLGEWGQEQEVFSLLIIDQHTFEVSSIRDSASVSIQKFC